MAISNSERQKKYNKRMAEQGFKRVVLYVPEDRVMEIKSIASRMRNEKDITLTAMQEAVKEAIKYMREDKPIAALEVLSDAVSGG